MPVITLSRRKGRVTAVCVVGGGRAGMEAAREASLLGAEVVVLERSLRPEPPWRAWPSLLDRTPCEGPRPPDRLPAGGSVSLERGVEVEAVCDGRATTASGRRVQADAFVVATGSLLAPQRFLGQRKSGIWILDSQSKYRALAKVLDAVSVAVVSGEGAGALQVSEQLRNRGCAVTLCLSKWDTGVPRPPLLEVLTDSAAASGVAVETGMPERAVGALALEGVILHGVVLPCDAFIVLPRRTPAPVRTDALTGARGGLLVDRWLRTSVPGLYAAGGCAEASPSFMACSSLEDSPASTGRAAGANAAGRAVGVSPYGLRSVSAFGVLWWRAGMSLGSSPPTGEAEVFDRRWGPDSACSITYDRRNGTVLGLEAVGSQTSGVPQPPMASLERVTLRTLAYGAVASTDISTMSDTARLALARWQGS